MQKSNNVVDQQIESLVLLKNDISINGSLYTLNELRIVLDLVEDIKSQIEANISYGNFTEVDSQLSML